MNPRGHGPSAVDSVDIHPPTPRPIASRGRMSTLPSVLDRNSSLTAQLLQAADTNADCDTTVPEKRLRLGSWRTGPRASSPETCP